MTRGSVTVARSPASSPKTSQMSYVRPGIRSRSREAVARPHTPRTRASLQGERGMTLSSFHAAPQTQAVPCACSRGAAPGAFRVDTTLAPRYAPCRTVSFPPLLCQVLGVLCGHHITSRHLRPTSRATLFSPHLRGFCGWGFVLFTSLLTGDAGIFSVGRGPHTMGVQNMGYHMASCRAVTRESGVTP